MVTKSICRNNIGQRYIIHIKNIQLICSTYTRYINVTQMMVGRQWAKSWGMYRWAVEACTYR